MDWEVQEKRKFLRTAFPCKVIVRSSHQELASNIENISEGGIRVTLEEELKLSSIVGLELFCGKDEPIRCEGHVLWIIRKVSPKLGKPTMFYTGIKFSRINNTDRNYIRKLVINGSGF